MLLLLMMVLLFCCGTVIDCIVLLMVLLTLLVTVLECCGGIVIGCIILVISKGGGWLGTSGGKDGKMGSEIDSSVSSSGSRALGRGLKFRMGVKSQLGGASALRLIIVPGRRSVG